MVRVRSQQFPRRLQQRRDSGELRSGDFEFEGLKIDQVWAGQIHNLRLGVRWD